jgi:TrpR-related protein YerC/YecD
MQTYPTKQDKELIKGFSQLSNEKEITGFLRDLLTPAEIEEFSRRFQIAKLLWTTNKSYADIADFVSTSTTTVTRVAHWLYKEPHQGYANVLKRMYGKSKR